MQIGVLDIDGDYIQSFFLNPSTSGRIGVHVQTSQNMWGQSNGMVGV